MRNFLRQFESIAIWGLFFATTVYGHVALKVAAGSSGHYDYRKAFDVLFTFWGWSAVLAWIISALLWVLVLTRHSVLAANSISALRYVLICAAAVLFLKEPVHWREASGIGLVCAGVWLLSR
jgi:drug/metabolite transporter (DMT)-like permease